MKKSVLDKLQDFKEDFSRSGFNSHFLVGIDLLEDGSPHASMMITKGKPFETLGMIDILITNLEDVKKEIIDQLSQKNNTKNTDTVSDQIEKAMEGLPKHVKDKIVNLKKRLSIAFEEQDQEALNKIKIELQQLNLDKTGLGNDDDDNNFNITDFKGGLA